MTRLGLRGHRSGATHGQLTLDESVRYVRAVFDDYLRYGDLSPESLRGQRILEIGPGDNFGLALLMLGHGAASVTTLDRFVPSSDHDKNIAIYRALVDTLPTPSAVTVVPERYSVAHGHEHVVLPLEEALHHFEPESFDLIVSRAVLEHVADLEASWLSMSRLLKGSGLMLHKVDFRCHGMFEDEGPLEFLTFEDALWSIISAPDPTLNRERLGRYIEVIARHGQRTDIWVTHVSSRDGELIPHVPLAAFKRTISASDSDILSDFRPRLASSLRHLQTLDLLVNGVFLRVRPCLAG